MRQALYRMSGVDLTGIDAIGVETVQVVLSEYGPDLSRFPTEKQFVSHVTLAPHKPTSAGKPVKKKKRNSASTRVAAALRMAATIAAPQRDGIRGVLSPALRDGSEEMWQCLPPPGNWPPSFTACCGGGSRTSTKARRPTKSDIRRAASKV